jgi:ribosome recycling factor
MKTPVWQLGKVERSEIEQRAKILTKNIQTSLNLVKNLNQKWEQASDDLNRGKKQLQELLDKYDLGR